jgi:hypothetical protein
MLSFLLDFRLANETELRHLYSVIFTLAIPFILLWETMFNISPGYFGGVAL